MSGPRISLVDLAAEYAEVGAAVEAAALRVLRSGRYLLDRETAAFEAELARMLGVRDVVSVGSGTQALSTALVAAGVEPGDEVVTSAFTFFATVEAIVHTGATPVVADVEPGGFHLAPAALAAAVGPRTRAVIPVHLFGRCADMTAIAGVASSNGLRVVEDAAQALGAAREGRSVGSTGHAAAFSFYPSKNLGAAGDAGAIATDDADVAEAARLLRNHGRAGDGRHRLPGSTARIDEIQATILRVKLPFLKRWNRERAANAARYAERLADCPELALPAAGAGELPVWSQYTLRSPRAPAIRAALSDANVECRHFYPRPVYREPAWDAVAPPASACPEAERACAESVSIPIRPGLTEPQIDRICDAVRSAL